MFRNMQPLQLEIHQETDLGGRQAFKNNMILFYSPLTHNLKFKHLGMGD